MKGRFIYIYLVIISLSVVSLYSESSEFGHPLRIEPAGIYNKVRVDGGYTERKASNVFEKDRNLSAEGEFIFLDKFSIKGGGGATKYNSTNTNPTLQNDRWNLGLKYANETGGKLRFVWGGGVRVFNKQIGENPRYDVAPDLYLVRPNLSLGFGIGILEFQADLSMLSETNTKFREANNKDFRRFYQAGGLVSLNLGSLRLLLESEYRVPYDKEVDSRSRFWNVYPGISYKIFDKSMISLSGQFPVNGEVGEQGRGFRFSFFQFF
jgi:hypothetical protein